MSLKSRLLSKNNINKEVPKEYNIETKTKTKNSSIDIISYFGAHPQYESLSIYGPDEIYVEENGIIEQADISFENLEDMKKVIYDIVHQYNISFDNENPSFSIVLANKIRINAIMPPLLKDGYYLSLTRFSKNVKAFDNACEEKLISSEMVLFLKECLNKRLNIFVVGEARTNKTRILNYLANLISKDQTIASLEVMPELKIRNGSVISLMRYKNSFIKLLRKALKLRPDRLVISDMTISELTGLYEYIISGYNGFLASFSIRSYENLINSLQNLILLNNPNMEEKNANSLIDSAMDIIVYVEKTQDNEERVTRISELSKIRTDLKLNEIFVWKENSSKSKKLLGNHISTGNKSKFFEQEEYFSIGFLESYYEKDYKHSYIGQMPKEIKAKLKPKAAVDKDKVKSKLDKYKKLKAKIKKGAK